MRTLKAHSSRLYYCSHVAPLLPSIAAIATTAHIAAKATVAVCVVVAAAIVLNAVIVPCRMLHMPVDVLCADIRSSLSIIHYKGRIILFSLQCNYDAPPRLFLTLPLTMH